MKFGNVLSGLAALAFCSVASWARAEDVGPVPNATPAPDAVRSGHASGLLVQGRVQATSGLLSLGGPGFLFGYQGPSYAIGLGASLTRIGLSQDGGASASASLFQIAPTAIVDVWHSTDGRARANLVGSVGYGRASLSSTTSVETCTAGPAGVDVCSTSNRDNSTGASLIPVALGFGGDYFLSRNFALGTEFGVQAIFVAGLDTTSNGRSSSVNASANAQFAYGVLRASFVIGD